LPPAAKTLFKKRVLDSQKLFIRGCFNHHLSSHLPLFERGAFSIVEMEEAGCVKMIIAATLYLKLISKYGIIYWRKMKLGEIYDGFPRDSGL
jgi:hypothetical protein